MRVIVYDKNPGSGIANRCLMLSWVVGCFLQKLFGKVDTYHGATSWDDAFQWLNQQSPPLLSIQFWHHGSPGMVWIAERAASLREFIVLQDQVTPDTIIWFRSCSVFQGQLGHLFSKWLANLLQCTVAGHTRIVGLLQGGLHTRKPGMDPSWSQTEGEFPKSWWPFWLRWGNNTVTCFATKVPEGW